MLTKCLCKFNVTPYQPNAIILSYRPIYKGTKLTRATKSEKNSLTQSKDHVVCTCQLCSVKTPTLLINTAASSKLKTPTHQTPPRRKQSSMTISSFVCCFVLTKKKKKEGHDPYYIGATNHSPMQFKFQPEKSVFLCLKENPFFHPPHFCPDSSTHVLLLNKPTKKIVWFGKYPFKKNY